MIDLDLRQLEYFLTVVEEESFTRAAARLHVVQSAVSAGIKSLETGLRVELVHRSPRHVSLTEAGRALLPRARATLSAARSAVDAVGEVHGVLHGEVRIGVMGSPPDVGLAAVLGRFRARHPRVRLRLANRPGGSRDLAAEVRGDRLDLALLSVPGPAERGLDLMPIASYGMGLVVPQGHRLAGRGSVALSELVDETFVDFPVGYGSRSVVDRAFAVFGQPRDVAVEVVNADTAASYARHGLGVAILPEPYLRSEPTARLTGPGSEDLSWSLSLALPTDRPAGAAARALAGMLHDLTHIPRTGE